ncbi:MAG: RapZ C-terminal domain-containing protein, partial [Burkholderiales bacterium]
RCLPNPNHDPRLRPLTGRDRPVIEFLGADPATRRMLEDVRRFVADWLPAFERDNRSYLTVAIGCTGGQHRSVYFAETLAAGFRDRSQVLVRHRELT